MASVKDGDGAAKQINAAHVDECPVSYITPESQQIVQIAMENHLTHERTGGVFLGSDSGQWPAWWHDAVVVIESCRAREEVAAMSRKV